MLEIFFIYKTIFIKIKKSIILMWDKYKIKVRIKKIKITIMWNILIPFSKILDNFFLTNLEKV